MTSSTSYPLGCADTGLPVSQKLARRRSTRPLPERCNGGEDYDGRPVPAWVLPLRESASRHKLSTVGVPNSVRPIQFQSPEIQRTSGNQARKSICYQADARISAHNTSAQERQREHQHARTDHDVESPVKRGVHSAMVAGELLQPITVAFGSCAVRRLSPRDLQT